MLLIVNYVCGGNVPDPPLLPSWTEYIYLAVNSLPEAEPECWDEDSQINQSRDRDIKGIPSILLMMHAGL